MSVDDGMNTSTGDYSQTRSRLQSAKAGSRPPATGGRVMNRPQTTIGGRRGMSAGVNKPPAGNKSDRIRSAYPGVPNSKLASDIAAVQSTLYHQENEIAQAKDRLIKIQNSNKIMRSQHDEAQARAFEEAQAVRM
jgi:hypothetical protein